MNHNFGLWFELWFKLWFEVWLKLWPKIEESSMISLRDGGLVAAFLVRGQAPARPWHLGPAALARPWHPGPRPRTKKMPPPTHHFEGKSSTILQFSARVLTIPQTII